MYDVYKIYKIYKVYSYRYHVFDPWQVNVVIYNEQCLKTTLAFVAKLGAAVSF